MFTITRHRLCHILSALEKCNEKHQFMANLISISRIEGNSTWTDVDSVPIPILTEEFLLSLVSLVKVTSSSE